MMPGELYWVEYPKTDGHEQMGRRPSLILQNDRYAKASPLVVVIPLTTANTLRFPSVVAVVADETNRLAANSFILVFQIRAIDRSRFSDYIGNVDTATLAVFMMPSTDSLDDLHRVETRDRFQLVMRRNQACGVGQRSITIHVVNSIATPIIDSSCIFATKMPYVPSTWNL
jgi:mRNA-degrading endonuclease toxin of MazEF toxin-antitoxin module